MSKETKLALGVAVAAGAIGLLLELLTGWFGLADLRLFNRDDETAGESAPQVPTTLATDSSRDVTIPSAVATSAPATTSTSPASVVTTAPVVTTVASAPTTLPEPPTTAAPQPRFLVAELAPVSKTWKPQLDKTINVAGEERPHSILWDFSCVGPSTYIEISYDLGSTA